MRRELAQRQGLGETPSPGVRQRLRRFGRTTTIWVLASNLTGCSLLPSEFNLSPLYRHRLDEHGKVLEMDVLWPVVHYEALAKGGSDFRIRPFYRRVSKPDLDGFGTPAKPVGDQPHTTTRTNAEPAPAALRQDHQFLWPLGRVRVTDTETHSRLWPLWSRDHRRFLDGGEESDWYFLFPFFWGGSSQKDPSKPAENYFGVFPLYFDAPGQFLTYDRFTAILWPLYVRTEKDKRVGHTFLWPFIGFGSDADGSTYWHRFLPLYSAIRRPGVFERLALLWPILSFGRERMNTEDPVSGFALWPLFSWQRSKSGKTRSWSFLWPFFRGQSIEGKKWQLDLLWPLFRRLEDNTRGNDVKQWWLWPFVSRTVAKHQQAWNFLWPLIWWRSYDDPDGLQTQQWVVPFFKHVKREWKTGGVDDYLQIWPLVHFEQKRSGTGEWRFPSPWFYRDGNAEGVGAAYDWLYTLACGEQRAPDDRAMHLAAHVFTTRTRGKRTQTSIPLLFSYVGDERQRTMYLFNLIPIPLGSARTTAR
ncbi:MAG: hypothetical protein H6836_09245 [Planctomycetes bacterium]|nr:hypothetical protein [Planctomycetota bacterium]